MNAPIVQSNEIVTLLGAGQVDDALFTESLRLAPTLVAADGGAKRALASGITPDAVIGDFDSLDPKLRWGLPPERVHHIKEQDSTDFDKALSRIDAPLILAIGFTGRRLDHELAVYNAMVRHADRPVIVLGEVDLCFHISLEITLTLPLGTRVSLFPMAETVCRSTGLRWATDHLTFAPWARVGTSNESAKDQVTLSPQDHGMLGILPLTESAAVIEGLRAAQSARGL